MHIAKSPDGVYFHYSNNNNDSPKINCGLQANKGKRLKKRGYRKNTSNEIVIDALPVKSNSQGKASSGMTSIYNQLLYKSRL